MSDKPRAKPEEPLEIDPYASPQHIGNRPATIKVFASEDHPGRGPVVMGLFGSMIGAALTTAFGALGAVVVWLFIGIFSGRAGSYFEDLIQSVVFVFFGGGYFSAYYGSVPGGLLGGVLGVIAGCNTAQIRNKLRWAAVLGMGVIGAAVGAYGSRYFGNRPGRFPLVFGLWPFLGAFIGLGTGVLGGRTLGGVIGTLCWGSGMRPTEVLAEEIDDNVLVAELAPTTEAQDN